MSKPNGAGQQLAQFKRGDVVRHRGSFQSGVVLNCEWREESDSFRPATWLYRIDWGGARYVPETVHDEIVLERVPTTE